MKIRILFPLIIFLTSWSLRAQDVAIPELKARVTDKTGTLSSGEINSLNRKLASFEEAKGSQVVVVLIPTTGDETIEQYTIRLAEAWKIGRGGVDDGVIMLFAMDDRKMRIEVGYGLEGALTDALSKRIISNVITPEFRSGHFYKGIDSGVDVVLSAVNGEELPPAVRQETASNGGGSGRFMGVLFVFGIIGLAVLKSILQKSMGKSKAVGVVSVIVFILGWIFMGLFLSIFITAVVSIFMAVPSGGGRGGRGGGGMYWGGGGGFSSGGGFGGGGFSGGGGGFGGGGASGGW